MIMNFPTLLEWLMSYLYLLAFVVDFPSFNRYRKLWKAIRVGDPSLGIVHGNPLL